MASAMSPVTPKPAAEFSTFAMTKSIDSRSTSAGIARRAISRPGLPKMSPMNRMRMLADRNAYLAAPAIVEAGEDDPQFAVAQRGARAGGVVRPFETDGAREPAERALRHVEARFAVLAEGRPLGSGNQDDVLREHDLDIGRLDAGDVEEELDRRFRLDHVERRRALGRCRPGLEQLKKIPREFPAFDVNTRHGGILALARRRSRFSGRNDLRQYMSVIRAY